MGGDHARFRNLAGLPGENPAASEPLALVEDRRFALVRHPGGSNAIQGQRAPQADFAERLRRQPAHFAS